MYSSSVRTVRMGTMSVLFTTNPRNPLAGGKKKKQLLNKERKYLFISQPPSPAIILSQNSTFRSLTSQISKLFRLWFPQP